VDALGGRVADAEQRLVRAVGHGGHLREGGCYFVLIICALSYNSPYKPPCK
jgi:hypothetical protein